MSMTTSLSTSRGAISSLSRRTQRTPHTRTQCTPHTRTHRKSIPADSLILGQIQAPEHFNDGEGSPVLRRDQEPPPFRGGMRRAYVLLCMLSWIVGGGRWAVAKRAWALPDVSVERLPGKVLGERGAFCGIGSGDGSPAYAVFLGE